MNLQKCLTASLVTALIGSLILITTGTNAFAQQQGKEVAKGKVAKGKDAKEKGVVKGKQLVKDMFTTAKFNPRNAARGDWKIEGGIASVTQDDAMFKKFKNHGPIMIYTVGHDDATAIVDIKPTGCRTVVFTMDAENGGHAFRVKLRTKRENDSPAEANGKKTNGKKAKSKKAKSKKGKAGPKSIIVTYAAKVGDAKAEQIVLNDQDVPSLIENEWNRLQVTVKGEHATVTLGNKTIKVQHPQIDQKKKVAKIGFSFGSMSLRNFQLSE